MTGTLLEALYLICIIGATALRGFLVPDGTGPIWLDNVNCRGFESRLIDCFASPLGTHNCRHFDDAGVRCAGPTCMEGDIRLAGGTNTSGRVEICYHDTWGTVCDDLWGTADAQVACRQLGLPETRKNAYKSVIIIIILLSYACADAIALFSGFTNGFGQIWLENIQCDGNETELIDCPASPFGIHSCNHFEDAGVSCPFPG